MRNAGEEAKSGLWILAVDKKTDKKAQISAEFLFILAASLIIIILISVIAQQQINSVQRQKDTVDTQNSLLDLASAAKEVYSQGEGSRKLVFIQLPGSYEPDASSVGNKSIQIRMAGTDYVSLVNFNVRGKLPQTPGGHWVWVVSEGNRVRIVDAMMELDPNRVYVVMDANSTKTFSFEVTNIWNGSLSVNTVTTWNNPQVAMSGVPSSFDIALADSYGITLQFNSGPGGGVFTGQIQLDANDGAGNTEDAEIPVTVQVIAPGGTVPTRDILGPIITLIYQFPSPAIKYQPLSIYVNASDILTGNNTIKGCQIDADNQNSWKTMLPVDGVYDQVTELSLYNFTSGFALGGHTIRAVCSDSANNTGPTGYYYFNVSEADQLGPIVIQMIHTDYPTTLSNISVGGIATDTYTGGSNVQYCNVKIDSGFWQNATPVDGAWDSPTENFTYNVGPVGVGYHSVYYQCTDSIGNAGGIYNDSFGVVDVDLMVVLDRSGSMAWNVTNVTDNRVLTGVSSTGWSYYKNLSVTTTNGNLANLTVELEASASGCTAYYNATINGIQVATGSRNATTYASLTSSINISTYQSPFTITLWLKRDKSGCTAYNRLLSVQQLPSKMNAAQAGAKSFLDVAGNNIQAGLTSFSTTSTLNKQLAPMTTDQQTLKNAIDALVASGSTCIECGLESACGELNSPRSRPTASKVVVLLTDGVGNYAPDGTNCNTPGCGIPWSVAGATYCRDRNITVYTIGFGNDVNDEELTDIALLTHGDYYFAPNVQTLTAIFESIGKH
jgi:hypothetical protein